ncbi:MAG: transketolase C-terminal domain-containing protein [Candidatus Saelkia tenebricola]|nr:transketolase C-terminal domain-containing protein [Candidatus Saelkia tenebricola]
MKALNKDIRDAFFDQLYSIAQQDKNVIFLTADMGAFSLAKFKKDLPSQFINMAVAEQNMVSIAAGLSLVDKNVFIYSIIPFTTLRCYEQIKIDICAMNLGVSIIGIGAGLSYASDGPTHHGTSDIALMRLLPEITILNPSNAVTAQACAQIAYKSTSPVYIRLEKGVLPLIDRQKEKDFSSGIFKVREGSDLTIISGGIMLQEAVKVADELKSHSIKAAVLDLYRIKPLNIELLLNLIDKSKIVVTLEENIIQGGIGTVISEVLAEARGDVFLKRIAIPDQHCFETGSREYMRSLYGLDVDSVVSTILDVFSQ